MPKSSTSSISEPMGHKLLEVDSDLATQEAHLAAQLEAIQKKRKSLQTVIQMFSFEQPLTPTAPAPATNAQPEETPPKPSASKRKRASSLKATRPEQKEPAPRSSRGSNKKKAQKLSSPLSQTSVDWQPYLKPEYRNLPLAQAVLIILERHPNEVVEVPSIMDDILVKNTPKDTRFAVRHRLSNVLSVGLKTQKWYRGGTGLYSVSKDAAEASLSSS